MIPEFYLCKLCVYNNGTRFCDAERCKDLEDHPDNECDRFVKDLDD